METHEIRRTERRRLVTAIFLQMLPATLLVPSIRPLFANYYGGDAGAMHAFMGLNMLGAAIIVPAIGARVDRAVKPARILAALAILDGLLLTALSLPLPVAFTLVLRFFEGAAHVGAATVLVGNLSRSANEASVRKTMGLAAAAIIFAIVLGSALGGMLVSLDVRLPLWVGAALSFGVAAWAPRYLVPARRMVARRRFGLAVLREYPSLVAPVSVAFVARFTIGCLVVTFALFAHRVHGLSDAAIGGLFALMTFPFAIATYPAARLGALVPSSVLLGGGVIGYGAALAAIGYVSTPVLPVLLVIAGLSSALIFSSVLYYATHEVPRQERGQAMALVNASGCLGMLLGPTVAGIATGVATKMGEPVAGYRIVFLIATGSLVVWLVSSHRWLARRYTHEARSEIGAERVVGVVE